jgi:hypothetical protein
VFSSRQPIDEADLEDDDDLFVEVGPAGADVGRTTARGAAPCAAGRAWPPGPSDIGQPIPVQATGRHRAPSMP